jgi:hypothetical protein
MVACHTTQLIRGGVTLIITEPLYNGRKPVPILVRYKQRSLYIILFRVLQEPSSTKKRIFITQKPCFRESSQVYRPDGIEMTISKLNTCRQE